MSASSQGLGASGANQSRPGSRSSRGSKDSLINRSQTPMANEELVKSLQGHNETLRGIITCKICYGLLYEPYTTACGHTYCYICFCKSFQPNGIPQCPECRTRLVAPPGPNYVVKEITQSFLARVELLPAGETLEQHKQWQKEHVDFIQKDKDNKDPRKGGLWRGHFRRRFLPRRPPIVDAEDGVTRCPFCTWELEDGICNRCELPIDENGGDWSFSETNSEQLSMMDEQDMVFEEMYGAAFGDGSMEEWYDAYEQDFDDEEDDAYEQPYSIQRMLGSRRPAPAPRRLASHSAAGSRSRYSASVIESEMGTLEEEDEDEEDEDSSMNGFIERDEPPARYGYGRESTSISRGASTSASSQASQISHLPSSIAEADVEDEGDDDDDMPITFQGRRRMQHTQSSTPTVTGSQRPSQSFRQRRVISESPSTESTSSAAPDEEEEDDIPISAVNRRRRRGHSQDEPVRRVRPRPRGNSNREESEENGDLMGYRPLGTPQIGDGEDELSDSARTTVGWEPITNDLRLRDTGSLTPTADRPSAPLRPSSRMSSSAFPLGTRGLRRISSIQSVSHYEDGDADDDVSETEAPGNVRTALHTRTSRARLRDNTTPQPPISTRLTQMRTNQNQNNDELSSDETDVPQVAGAARRRRPEVNPHVRLALAEFQANQADLEPEGPVYAEFEHLRTLSNRTPVAHPRTSNRARNNSNHGSPNINTNTTIASPTYATRNSQTFYSPTRTRGMAEAMSQGTGMHARSSSSQYMASPRGSISGPSYNASRLRNVMDAASALNDISSSEQSNASTVRPPMAERAQPSNLALLRALNNAAGRRTPTAAPSSSRPNMLASPSMNPHSPRLNNFADFIDRPDSRVSYRGSGLVANRPPSASNRPPSANNRPPSTGGRRNSIPRSPFASPQVGTAAVGLGTARTFPSNNPFFQAPRPRQSTQRLRQQASNQTLRPSNSIRVLRAPPPQDPSPEDEFDLPGLRRGASRLHLRREPSQRRLQITRDGGLPQYGQPSPPPASRYSPTGLSAQSVQERANDLIRTRLQELAQQERTSPAQQARQRDTSAQAIQRRLAETMRAGAQRQPSANTAAAQTPAPAPAAVNHTVTPVGSAQARPNRVPAQANMTSARTTALHLPSQVSPPSTTRQPPRTANTSALHLSSQVSAPTISRQQPVTANTTATTETSARPNIPAMTAPPLTTAGDRRRT